MLARHSSVRVVPRHGSPSTTAVVDGVLDRTTRPLLRDGLLALAAESADGLLADIENLEIRDPALIGVFALVALRVAEWPAVPFALVTGRDDQRAMLAGQSVPVYPDAGTAEAALKRPDRRRAGRMAARTSARARGFVRGVCDRWRVPELAEDAELIATEFVENVLRHTDSVPRLGLVLRRGTLTVEVADESARPAVVREGLDPTETGLGLRMVAKVAKTWGSSRRRSGGKTVWAVLRRG
ncbi:ATP-binding protein [Amycolatopsis mongoliensis]|uniref:ATP-binding protein n=1 Tax=Amycolatopsis mongoliensis TaxID=715475 RepID=A0A9Y2NJ35_9PSEU|nr:ATP-binding protein [Amycolatopsis sp. 4-36]WIY07516.1 ATP-binding protein [Amycolatopsis sp. 4-36]